MTNKCYQPELCENEVVFVSARHSNEQVLVTVGTETVVPTEFRITDEYCPIDCRLFIQEHDVVSEFDRTTGDLKLYTNDDAFIGKYFDYAIRCESVFSSSGVQTSGVIAFDYDPSDTTPTPSTNEPTRFGDDTIFRLNGQSSGSCSGSSGVSISEYDELLPKNELKDLEFHLYGSISSMSVSCEQVECTAV